RTARATTPCSSPLIPSPPRTTPFPYTTLFRSTARPSGGRIAAFRREKTNGVVAPVVVELAVEQALVLNEGVDGHQLDGGDAEGLQILDDGRRGETGIRAAQVLRHIGMVHGQALHVRLVDDGLAPRDPRRSIGAPRERGVDDHRLRHEGCAVEVVAGEVG